MYFEEHYCKMRHRADNFRSQHITASSRTNPFLLYDEMEQLVGTTRANGHHVRQPGVPSRASIAASSLAMSADAGGFPLWPSPRPDDDVDEDDAEDDLVCSPRAPLSNG
jgi:hypothetical protein